MNEEVANEYFGIHNADPIVYCGLRIIEATEKNMKSLKQENALGPDMVPTRILKRCAKVSAPVLHMLIVAVLTFGK